MAGRAKFFELLDFPKFACPSVLGIDSSETALNFMERLDGGGFMSYGQIWSRLGLIVSGLATEGFIKAEFSSYKDDWKNESIRDVARRLKAHFGGRGRWYPLSTKPKKVLGFWFKPSIKGIWFVDGQAYAVLINARKGQPLAADHLRFLARGVYELHCIDDPNDPLPLIIDVSEHDKGEGRSLNAHIIRLEEAISFQDFDDAVRSFVKALELAGVARPIDVGDSIVDLFKKK